MVAGSSGSPWTIASTRFKARSMKRSKIFSWISARLGQVQTSPWLNANMTKPSIALSKKSSSSARTSLKKMLGDLPPSSSVTGIRFWLAYCMMSRPVDVSPVKAILEMRATRTGADLALVEREHDEAFDRLVEEIIMFAFNQGEV